MKAEEWVLVTYATASMLCSSYVSIDFYLRYGSKLFNNSTVLVFLMNLMYSLGLLSFLLEYCSLPFDLVCEILAGVSYYCNLSTIVTAFVISLKAYILIFSDRLIIRNFKLKLHYFVLILVFPLITFLPFMISSKDDLHHKHGYDNCGYKINMLSVFSFYGWIALLMLAASCLLLTVLMKGSFGALKAIRRFFVYVYTLFVGWGVRVIGQLIFYKSGKHIHIFLTMCPITCGFVFLCIYLDQKSSEVLTDFHEPVYNRETETGNPESLPYDYENEEIM